MAPPPHGQDRRTPLYLVGTTSILVGIGSFLFHMSGTFIGEFIDLSTMYLIGALMVALEARRFVELGTARVTLLFIGISSGSMVLVLAFRRIGIVLFAVQVALVYASNIYWKLQKAPVVHRHAFLLGTTFAVAFAIWLLDFAGAVCAPDNHIFNGHAVWHVLSALRLYFFYRHQEQFVPPHGAWTRELGSRALRTRGAREAARRPGASAAPPSGPAAEDEPDAQRPAGASSVEPTAQARRATTRTRAPPSGYSLARRRRA